MIWLKHSGNRLYGFMGYVVDEAEGAHLAEGADRADGTDETDVNEMALSINALLLLYFDCLVDKEFKNIA